MRKSTVDTGGYLAPSSLDVDRLPFPRRCDGIARRANRIFLVGLAGGIGAFAFWANLTVLDKVKRGMGRVIPQTQNQIVQHLEGGIVSDILVKEGDRVEKGAVLFRVENSFSRAELSQARLEIKARKVRLARLAAEADSVATFSPDSGLVTGIPGIVEAERAIFRTHLEVVAEQLAILEEQLKQKTLELSELKARWSNTTAERELVMQQVASLRNLAALGAVSSNDLLDHERALQQIDSRLSDLTTGIPRTESAMAEITRRKTEVRLTVRTSAEKEGSDTRLQIAKLEEAVSAMVDRNARSDVLAPIAGAVNKLFVTTRGGVVKSGEPLAQIVPADVSFAIEARLSPSDRAEVWPGLPAVVKISAYDYSVYGALKGRVTEISSDALQDERGQPYFRVRLKATATDFGPQRPVVPGMVAEVDILAGRQTVMESILRPARRLRDNAMRL